MDEWIIDIDRENPDINERDYPVLFRTCQKLFPEMDRQSISLMVDVVTGVCRHCYEDRASCQCWNDE